MQIVRFTGRLFQSALFLLIGGVFVGVGVFLGIFASRGASEEANRVEALAILDLADIDAGQPGSPALIEGTVSRRNPSRFRNFAAYIREEYHGEDSDGDDDWRVDERVTPVLLVDVGGGIVQIGNTDYSISRPHESWSESSVLVWNGLTGEGTKRYKGLVVGRPLLAIGTIHTGREGNEVYAEQVFGGTQAEYVADQRQTARFLPWFGLIFGVIGLILLGAGIKQLLFG